MNAKTILCAGGGTAGSIVPLSVLISKRRRLIPGAGSDRIIWIGTSSEIDQRYLPPNISAFRTLPVAKWRRYISVVNIFTPFLFLVGFLKSIGYCLWYRPDVVWTAGSFVGVPIAWAAWLLRIPVLSIQQDVIRGLANRLIEVVATQRVLTIPKQLVENPSRKPYVTIGMIVAREQNSPRRTQQPKIPLLLVLGGSSGAQSLNSLVWASLPQLPHTIEIIHSIGSGASAPPGITHPQYHAISSIDHAELLALIERSALVISRAGMNTIAECALFHKPTIVVPLPGSQQRANALAVERNGAALIIDQSTITPEAFAQQVINFITHPSKARVLGDHLSRLFPPASSEDILDLVRV